MFEISRNNFNDWFRQLKIVLRVEKKLFVIEQPISLASPTDSEYLRNGIRYLIHNEELKSMFEKQAGVEWFDLIQTFHAQVNSHVRHEHHPDPIYHEIGLLDTKTDVYSHGIVMFEMLMWMVANDEKVIGDYKPQRLINIVRRCYDNRPEQLIDPVLRDHIDPRSFQMFIDIAYRCISFNLKDRPTMDEVAKTLMEAMDIHSKNDPDPNVGSLKVRVEERWGSSFNMGGARVFNNFIANAGLIDLQLEGGSTIDIPSLAWKCNNFLFRIKGGETRDFMQKAKIKWAVEGDENSKFLHGHVKSKRANLFRERMSPTNMISHLFYAADGGFIGEWSHEKKPLLKEFFNVFQDGEKNRSGLNGQAFLLKGSWRLDRRSLCCFPSNVEFRNVKKLKRYFTTRWWNLAWHPFDSYTSWLSWFKALRMSSSAKEVLEGKLAPSPSGDLRPTKENIAKFSIPLEEMRRAMSKCQKIAGCGFYRTELFGDYGQEGPVALKRFNGDDKSFQAKLEIVSRLQHQNIIPFIGFSESEIMGTILVYECADNGSLSTYLNKLTWAQRLTICIGAAKGLKYLHSGLGEYESVIHAEFTSHNILISDNLEAKICGLDSSILVPRNNPDTKVYKKLVGRQEMDPVYRESYIPKVESNVYSLGVVLFEILTGKLVNTKCDGDEEISLMALVRRHYGDGFDEFIDPRISDEIDVRSLRICKEIAYKCISYNIKDRPSLNRIIKRLEEALYTQRSTVMGRSLQHQKLEDFRIPLMDINSAIGVKGPETKIGDGGFGVVYKGQPLARWQNRTVAIKFLRPKSYQGEYEFRNVADMLFSF
ncbi:protein kinase, ATP binding site-containing protein [Tanacetum coccineum]